METTRAALIGKYSWRAEYKMRKYGIGDIGEKVIQEYEDAMAAFDQQERPEEINIAIVGRPNVGKSSLLNSLFGDQRAIVSDLAGTTRDSIDALMERPAESEGDLPTIYRFVDTAGIRRKGKIDFGPEFFMVNRALRAIRRADVGKLPSQPRCIRQDWENGMCFV